MRYDNELETWWASLPVSQKERIARKAQKKAGKEPDDSVVTYPACTVWWNAQTEEKQRSIHEHCTSRHGYLTPEWNEADPYGD